MVDRRIVSNDIALIQAYHHEFGDQFVQLTLLRGAPAKLGTQSFEFTHGHNGY